MHMPETRTGAASAVAPWTCPTCGAGNDTAYCGSCGEKRLDHHDLTIVGVIEHAFESLTHVDGRIFRSIRDLIVRPGALTHAFVTGRRRPYFAPFQLFVVMNLVFFVAQSALGFQVLSNDLGSHIGQWRTSRQYYSRIARPLAERRLAETHRTLEEYTDVFNHAVRVNAKALVVLIVPAVALFLLLLFPGGSDHPTLTALVFALHFVAFFLLCEALMMPLIGLPAGWLLRRASLAQSWDMVVSTLLIVALAVWLYKAFRLVYASSPAVAVVKATALGVLFVPLLIAYRFVVFLVTLYTT